MTIHFTNLLIFSSLLKIYLSFVSNSVKKRIFAAMKRELSILIPTYNHRCLPLVRELARQASRAEGLSWEVIVAEDGSTDKQALADNSRVSLLPRCRQVILPHNIGRAAIRNHLARLARYSTLLFIDSDMDVSLDDYLSRFLSANGEVVYGGYRVSERVTPCLRSRYERAASPSRALSRRLQRPYHALRACNLMVSRELMLRFPFDERFSRYGFEDTMLGKTLMRHHVPICHIDAPVDFDCQESDLDFMEKTEEALRTLHRFEDELADMSSLLALTLELDRLHVSRIFRFSHRHLGKAVRHALISKRPPLWLFQLYKLGYLMSIRRHP